MNTRIKQQNKQASASDFLWFAAMLSGMALIFSGLNLGWILIIPCLAKLD